MQKSQLPYRYLSEQEKEQQRKYMRAYRQRNLGNCQTITEVWIENHREQYNEYQRLYREQHKEEIRARNRAYYLAHKEELLAKHREYYQKNKDKIVAKRKQEKEGQPAET